MFSWLAKNHFIPDSPALEIEMPREERRLPRYVFTAREAEQVLQRPKVKTLTGIRDRAILETLYSSAIRRGELLGLKVQEVDTERGLLRINHGKGGRDRVVPIGQRALDWIERYRAEARSRWVRDENETALFLTKRGTRLSTNHVSALVRRYVKRANLGKEGSCHLFRHTCATVLLENGANIRHIQQLLGHASLETTQIYTHVTVSDLKQVHNQCHPTAQRPPSDTPTGPPPPA